MTLVDPSTGEVVLAAPEQMSSLVVVDDQCAAVEAWAETCESIPELQDAGHKLAAIGAYLESTSIEGRNRVAAAQRRLEVRIGELVGPARPIAGPGRGKASVANDGLSRDERHDFRKMAAHPDAVEQVIAESTDEEPASRRKVMHAVKPAQPRRTPIGDDARNVGWELRKAVDRVVRLQADDRFDSNKDQMAAQLCSHLVYTVEVCQDLLDQLTQGE